MERETKAFRYEIVFRGIQPCFLYGRSEHLACFEPTKAARFLTTLEVHSVRYNQSTFLKRILHFDIDVKEKPQNVHLKLIFLPCARPI